MLKEGCYYHIYNRGINSQDIFFSDKDFIRFLEKYKYYLGLSLETLAYCLMKNHFHLLVRVFSKVEHEKFTSGLLLSDDQNINYYILPNPEKRTFKIEILLSHHFNSYTKYINSKYRRTGTLWDGNFNLREIDTEEYLQKCICYIHRNPIHHGLTSSYETYSYSSFKEVLNNQSIIINSSATLNLFGNRENYLAAHQKMKLFPESYKLE